MSLRYTAYALALELGQADVDTMLAKMTAMQFNEWLAFFKLRNEKEADAPQGNPQGGYGTGKEAQQRMSGDMLRALDGYQSRRDKQKGK